MSSATERFEAWRLANHPCYTASPQQGFEAGFLAGASDMRERAAEECERMAAEILTARDEQWRYEQEKGYSNGPLRAGYTSEIQALTERAAGIRALSPSPTPEEQSDE